MALVCAAADAAPEARIELEAVESAGRTKTIEQIASEHKARWKQPVSEQPSAAEIIRAERDDAALAFRDFENTAPEHIVTGKLG